MFRGCVFLSVVMVMILVLSACGGSPVEEEEVAFPDTNLEIAVRKAIDKPEGAALSSDLEELTNMVASQRGITNLTGLEHCTGLTVLNLYDNKISDLSPLASLTNLTELYLCSNQISDISPLANLTSLTVLGLHFNQLSDLSPVASLTNLTELRCSGNPLNTESVSLHIPQLEERGVEVKR